MLRKWMESVGDSNEKNEDIRIGGNRDQPFNLFITVDGKINKHI